MERRRMWRSSNEISSTCPRCGSFNTKFCYYNNYSLSQPRYFCRSCRRYWTKGGSLRNVPIGGGCRKNKRRKTMNVSISSSAVRAGFVDQGRTVSDRDDHQHVYQIPSSSPEGNHQHDPGHVSDENSRDFMEFCNEFNSIDENVMLLSIPGEEISWPDSDQMDMEIHLPCQISNRFSDTDL